MKKVLFLLTIVISCYLQAQETPFETLLKKAQKGDAQAQYEVADRYDKGRGTELNYKEAFKWYKKAAEKGQLDAQFKLIDIYSTHIKNEKKAHQWTKRFLKRANAQSEKNDAKAMYLLALYYNSQSQQLFKKAVKQQEAKIKDGDAKAAYELAQMYDNKLNNQGAAKKWYEKAAQYGDSEAQYKTGMLYLQLQNRKKAIFWLKKALANQDIAGYTKILANNELRRIDKGYARTHKKMDGAMYGDMPIPDYEEE